MGDYRKLLEHSFAVEVRDGLCPPESRLEYLAQHIFNFATYDGEMDALFARKGIETCAAITNGTTFEYIKDADNYRWYLIMCNMPFFVNRTDWGSSIRGAWWGAPQELDTCGFWDESEQMRGPFRFAVDEWTSFVRAVIEFAAPEMPPPAAQSSAPLLRLGGQRDGSKPMPS